MKLISGLVFAFVAAQGEKKTSFLLKFFEIYIKNKKRI